MPKVKKIEFWLVALLVLIVVAVVAAGFDQVAIAGGVIPALAVAWLVLAIFWMVREIFRRIAD